MLSIWINWISHTLGFEPITLHRTISIYWSNQVGIHLFQSGPLTSYYLQCSLSLQFFTTWPSTFQYYYISTLILIIPSLPIFPPLVKISLSLSPHSHSSFFPNISFPSSPFPQIIFQQWLFAHFIWCWFSELYSWFGNSEGRWVVRLQSPCGRRCTGQRSQQCNSSS